MLVGAMYDYSDLKKEKSAQKQEHLCSDMQNSKDHQKSKIQSLHTSYLFITKTLITKHGTPQSKSTITPFPIHNQISITDSTYAIFSSV